jgi:type IV pilus assembly protein PilY1
MKIQCKWLNLSLLAACFFSALVHAEDIDIFTGTTEVDTSLPNVIFVLDNTSNWSRASQKWPGGIVQGQSEVRAIKLALADKTNKLNVGIMEYVTGGSSATTDAGYTRFKLQKLTPTNQTAFNLVLDTIYGDINGPTEKRSSSNPYGYLPWDFYNYLSGSNQSKGGAGTPASLADAGAYVTQWSQFRSPLSDADACADTYMIFIGNNANGSVAGDDATNTAALKALYTSLGLTAPNALAGDSSGTALGVPEFACTTVTSPGPIITPEQVIPPVPAYCDPPVTVPGTAFPAQTAKALGTSLACYKTSQAAACTTAERARVGGPCNVSPTPPYAPVPTTGTCNCVAATTSSTSGCVTTGSPANRTYHLNITGNIAAYSNPSTTTQQCYPAVPGYTIPAVRGPDEVSDVCATTGVTNTTLGKNYNFDDWTLFLQKHGIPLTVTVDGSPVQQRVKVTTYVIDVFNAQQSATLSAIWFGAANAGNGRYFQAKNEQQLIDAINAAAADILAESSSFAAVSLPLSATNRARVDNQVYIGMFRPSLGKKPRWFGNLKRYQLALFNDIPGLADATLRTAAVPDDGNLKPCAQSFWTEDSDTYWLPMLIDPSVENTRCEGVEPWSDLPDGDFVEKGGAAQQTRQLADGTERTLKTVDSGGTSLRDLAVSDATAMGGTAVFNYLRGDVAGTGEVMPASGLRASIHGDVVHSRPLAIRYSADDVTLFYGANDGFFRAVDPEDGTERWALVAPEHFGKLQRLYNNTPLIKYTGAETGGETLKDYFFDGATGQLLLYDDDNEITQAYIYPTQRRGGRMVYALDVTDPDGAPALLWRVGCPSLTSDTGCTTGFTDIGQTWSAPVGGFAKGYPGGTATPKQVVAFGGGFDDCLNADTAAYPSGCSTANGKGVYILDAATGALLKYLATDAPVVSELSPIDMDFDGNLDFFYAADVAGDLYRVNLTDMAALDASDLDKGFTFSALTKDNWTIVKIGSVADNERRFYNAPAAGAFQGRVIVTLGSGDRERPLEINYPFTAEVQNRFYAFFDEPYKTFVANPSGPLDADEATTVNLDGDTMLAVVDDEDTEAFSKEFDGWYMDLPDRGEQVANAAVIGGGRVFFNTFQPGSKEVVGLCERPLGIGTGYEVSLFGPEFTEGEEIAAPGFPIPPAIFTVLLPPGEPDCVVGEACEAPTGVQCDTEADNCRVVTLCIGCRDLSDLPEIVPDAPPIRRRIFFTEDIDRTENPDG